MKMKLLQAGLIIAGIATLTACHTVQGTVQGAGEDVQAVTHTMEPEQKAKPVHHMKHKKHHHKKKMMKKSSSTEQNMENKSTTEQNMENKSTTEQSGTTQKSNETSTTY